MKKQILLIALVLVGNQVSIAQNFEGKIVYRNSYISKLPQVQDIQFTAMMGSVQEYFIKGGNYKSVTNGTFAQMQFYIQSDNRLYSKFAISDTLFWTDAVNDSDPVSKFSVLKDQEIVMGIRCDAIVIETKSGKATYYFNTMYAVDPYQYKNHRFGNWAFLMDKIKALPLKIVMENSQFKLVSIATEVKEQELDSNMFKLPDGTVIKPSPF